MADTLKSYIKKLEKLTENIPTIMLQLADHETEKAIGEIKKKTPRVTSLLINSWHRGTSFIKGTRYYGVIVNNVEYASHVDQGHRIVRGGKTIGRVKGQFIVKRGLQQYKATIMAPSVKAFINKKMKDALK